MSRNRLVYAGGTFDVPHIGHVNFLQQCAEYGQVVVSLNSDEFVESYKGESPLFSFDERKELLEHLPFVSEVVLNIGGADSKVEIDLIKPDIICIGSDWAKKDYYSQMGFTQDWLDERGITLIYIPYTRLVSTSLIKARIHGRNGRSAGV